MITVAIIEDNRLIRERLTDLFREQADMTVVLAAAGADAATLLECKPRVVVLDPGLEGQDSLRLAELVRQELPDTRVVVMDLVPLHDEIAAFVNAGVAGFILKDATFDEFVGTIRAVAGGARVLPSQMTGTLFAQIADVEATMGTEMARDAVMMTQRERQVVALIATGMSNAEIAQQLHIATHTVKSHVRNVMEKLALHTRLQIAAFVHKRDAG